MDERRPLIPRERDFYSYCFLTKDLVDTRECKVDYFLLFSCCFPCALITDIIIFLPQCISNNVELCFSI